MIDKRNTGKFVSVTFLLLFALAGLGYRLFCLHLGPSELDRSRVEGSRHLEREIIIGRGRIYDWRGGDNVLALDLNLKNVIADPVHIIENGQVELVTSSLASVLGMTPAEVMSRVDRPGRRFERIQCFLPEDKIRLIKEMQLPGIYFREVTRRYYPQNSFMCHVIGFSNYEGVGSSGVEQTMNRFLRGCPGLLESKVDVHQRELPDRRIQDIPPREGADVYLSLDQQVQYIVEKVLDKTMQEHDARGVWAIVQRIRTGEILAMANRPAFGLNEFSKASEAERLNRAIGVVYEPGSTMKIATIAGVLDDGLAKPSDMLYCENGSWWYQRRRLRDYRPYGELSVADILKKSSNIGVAKLAIMLGDQRLTDYLQKFGLGSRMGIDLPGEEAGILHPVTKWSRISSSRIAIGQGVSVTALQMLGALCAIANDGVLMRPYVVKHVVGNDGSILYERRPQELGRAIRKQTADLMMRLLTRVTEDGGTGRRARVDGYTVAGKTGTAQKPIGGRYSERDYVASFVGVLPAERPELGIIIVVDEPQPFHTGGVVAAPAFSEIAGQAVRYLDILPSAEHRKIQMVHGYTGDETGRDS